MANAPAPQPGAAPVVAIAPEPVATAPMPAEAFAPAEPTRPATAQPLAEARTQPSAASVPASALPASAPALALAARSTGREQVTGQHDDRGHTAAPQLATAPALWQDASAPPPPVAAIAAATATAPPLPQPLRPALPRSGAAPALMDTAAVAAAPDRMPLSVPDAAPLRPSVHPPADAQQPAPIREVPVHIAKAVGDGRQELTVALRPAELGHLTIRLQFADGLVQVDVRADRPETLHLLQREADGFERSLRQAGLELRDGGLQFSTSGDGSRQRSANGGPDWHAGSLFAENDAETPTPAGHRPEPARPGQTLSLADDRLDLRI